MIIIEGFHIAILEEARRFVIYAFGDAENDITMLKNCGLGVCMANGQDRAKEAADMICGDNDHDGIAYALKKILER